MSKAISLSCLLSYSILTGLIHSWEGETKSSNSMICTAELNFDIELMIGDQSGEYFNQSKGLV